MAERPLLTMPRPERQTRQPRLSPTGKIPAADPGRQAGRLSTKPECLEQVPVRPSALSQLRYDPSAVVSERVLVFDVASNVPDFYRAVGGVPNLEFLGEDEGAAARDDDFFIRDDRRSPRPDRRVRQRLRASVRVRP